MMRTIMFNNNWISILLLIHLIIMVHGLDDIIPECTVNTNESTVCPYNSHWIRICHRGRYEMGIEMCVDEFSWKQRYRRGDTCGACSSSSSSSSGGTPTARNGFTTMDGDKYRNLRGRKPTSSDVSSTKMEIHQKQQEESGEKLIQMQKTTK